MSVTDKLNQLNTIKANIKAAINSKGQTVDDNMNTYAAAITNISTGITPTGTLNINENGNYDVSTYAAVDVSINNVSINEKNLITRDASVYVIPEGITKIGSYAFYWNLGNNGFVITSFPNSITSIEEHAFHYSYLSGNIYLPNVKIIHGYAFNNCHINSLDAPNLTTLQGADIFYNCNTLASVNIPKVDVIPDSCFRRCYNLNSITFSPTISSIGNQCFDNCIALNNLTFLNTTAPTIKYNSFENIASGGVLRYPKGADYSSIINVLPSDWTTEEIE